MKNNKKVNKKTSKTLVIKETKMPVSKSYRITSKDAQIDSVKGIGSHGIRVVHSEYIQDIASTGSQSGYNGFNITKFEINPGLSGPFPWLYRMAPNFETYIIDSFTVTYVPNNATIIPGSIMMVADFDPTDPTPTNKTDFLNKTGQVSGNVYNKLIYTPKKSDYNKQKSYYLRYPSHTVSPDDLKFFDCMNVFVAYQGTQPNTTLGELHFSYNVRLLTPTSDSGLTHINNILSFVGRTFGFGSGNNAGNSAPFGTDFVAGKDSISGNYSPFSWVQGIASDTNSGFIHFMCDKITHKMIEFVFQIASGTFAFPLVSRILQKNTSYMNSGNGIVSLDEDFVDNEASLDQLYTSGLDPLSNGWTDVSSTNLLLWYNWGFTNSTNNYYTCNATFALSPSQVLEFKWPNNQGGGIGVTFSSLKVLFTDTNYGISGYIAGGSDGDVVTQLPLDQQQL